MNGISIFTLTSSLHDETSVKRISDEFLRSVLPDGFDFRGADLSTFGEHDLDLIFVRTGGSEGLFKAVLPTLLEKGIRRFHLLTSGKSNSLAASMEILSYLNKSGLSGEIIHGSVAYVSSRIKALASVEAAKKKLCGMRLGVIGKPSDWLIASDADAGSIKEKLGIELLDIPMQVLLDRYETTSGEQAPDLPMATDVRASFPGASKIYSALKSIVADYRLGGLTIRCFDLLTSVHNTGCLALSRLNSEGIPSGCEGDVPALLSMAITNSVTGVSGFQANPSRIDVETGEILFAHCTIPFNMVSSFAFDTHFESGIGVGIRGHFDEGPVTVFKVSGDLRRSFIAEGTLLRNQAEPDLCRTQVVLRLSPDEARYFLTNPIGNHHIIMPGHHAAVLKEIFQ